MIGIIREWLWALLGECRRSRRDSTAMGRLSSTAERMRIARGVRDFMEQNYDLRYNVMKQTEEFRPKNRQDGTCENYDGRNFSNDGPNLSNDGRNSSNDGADWRQLTDREIWRRASSPRTGRNWRRAEPARAARAPIIMVAAQAVIPIRTMAVAKTAARVRTLISKLN